MSEADDSLPRGDQIEAMSRKDLRAKLHHMINRAETASGPSSVLMFFFMRAQYLRDEVAHRDQDQETRKMIRLTWIITGLTLAIAIMTAVIVVATVRPQWLQSAAAGSPPPIVAARAQAR